MAEMTSDTGGGLDFKLDEEISISPSSGVRPKSPIDILAGAESALEKSAKTATHVTLPVGVGFGIRDATSAQAIAAHADAVVIGSRIIQEISAGPAVTAAERAGAWLAGIRSALDSMRKQAA